MVETDGNALRRCLGKAETLPLAGPDQQVAEPCVERRLAVGSGRVGCDSVEFGVVVNLEVHGGAFYRSAAVKDRYDRVPCRHIAAYHVDFGVARGALYDILRPAVVAVYLGVQQQGPRHGGVEPGVVEGGRRLAGSHKVPAAVGIDLHPGVVVVGMGPSGRIDLAGRDAGGTQGGHCEHGLLSATAHTAAYRGYGAARAGVGRLVAGLLVAPMVDFQGCGGDIHTLHAAA